MLNHSEQADTAVFHQKMIVIVGLMGAGKSSVGRRLAHRLDMDFVDADREIEAAAGCTISAFFDRFGEAEFRRVEQRVIERILSGSPVVLATGGGAYMSKRPYRDSRKRGVLVSEGRYRCPVRTCESPPRPPAAGAERP